MIIGIRGRGTPAVVSLLVWVYAEVCPDNLIPKGRFESWERMGGADFRLKNKWTPQGHKPPPSSFPETTKLATVKK